MCVLCVMGIPLADPSLSLSLIARHERADAELSRLMDRSASTCAFVDDAVADQRCGDHQVSSLLIAPTQRLVRQQMFLQRLAKTTDKHHPDAEPLKAAELTWRATLDLCNVVAGNHAMQRRAECVAKVIDGAPSTVVITAPGRLLTHEGSLTKIGNSTVRPDYFFLFETLSATELLHTSAPDANGQRLTTESILVWFWKLEVSLESLSVSVVSNLDTMDQCAEEPARPRRARFGVLEIVTRPDTVSTTLQNSIGNSLKKSILSCWAFQANGHFAFKRFLRVLHVEDVEIGETGQHGAVRRSSLYGASRLGRTSSASNDSCD